MLETSPGKTASDLPHPGLPDASEPSRNIPSLDGIRAMAILLVILAHSSWYIPASMTQNSIFHSVIGNGYHGVAVFFVLSGYLITTLLLRELSKNGTVSLKRFYFRRTMRIFPPFYFFLTVMGGLWFAHIIPEDMRSFIASLTYTWAYYPAAHGYFIAHTWSLSIEEQFYLIWPFAFIVLHRKDRLVLANCIIILLMPLVRILFYFAFPATRGHEFYMLQGWIDTMMIGCLLALLNHRSKWGQWRRRYVNGWSATTMVLLGFYVNPMVTALLPHRISGLFTVAISPTITALCIGGMMLYLIGTKSQLLLALFNNRVIRHVGVISYSLYLWQQLFMSQHLSFLPYGYLYAFVAAELSFWLIEKPSLLLRPRMEAAWLHQAM